MTTLVAILALWRLKVTKTVSISPREFVDWKAIYNTSYPPEENKYREVVFYANLREIDAHNLNILATYKRGINKFTALTDD